MLDLDFLEIGTSDYDTLIEKADDYTVGISVEPMKIYSDRLPKRKNVKIINVAISDKPEHEDYMYYLDENLIAEHGLPEWGRGCNQLGKIHHIHEGWKLEKEVKKIKVKVIPISQLLIENNVRKIFHLKLDIEGMDLKVLDSLLDYLKDKENIFYPTHIEFEVNEITDKKHLLQIINRYYEFDYEISWVKNEGMFFRYKHHSPTKN